MVPRILRFLFLILVTVYQVKSDAVWMTFNNTQVITCFDMQQIDVHNITLDNDALPSLGEINNNITCSVEMILNSTKQTCNGITTCTMSPQTLTNEICKWQNGMQLHVFYTCKPVFPCNITITGLKKESFEKKLHGRLAGWSRDPLWQPDSIFYLPISKHSATQTIYKYPSLDRFKAGWPFVKYHLPVPPTSTSFAMCNGNLYYAKNRSPTIIKYSLKLRKKVTEGKLKNAYHNGEASFGESEWEGSDIEFAVDEHGLWALYASPQSEGNLIVSQINMSDLSIIKTWEISENKSNLLNCFIVCGMVFMIKHEPFVSQVFHTGTNETVVLPKAFLMTQPWHNVVSTSYNPQDNLLYVAGLEEMSVYSFENLPTVADNFTHFITESSPTLHLTPTTPILNLNGVSDNISCPEVTHQSMLFPSVLANTEVAVSCPGKINQFVTWKCVLINESTAVWKISGPNFNTCNQSTLEPLPPKNIALLNSASVLLKIVKRENNLSTEIRSEDIESFSRLMFNISTQYNSTLDKSPSISQHIYESLLETSNAIMDVGTSSSWNQMEELNRSIAFTNIMDTMESSAFQYANKLTPGSQKTYSQPSIDMMVQVVNISNEDISKMLKLHIEPNITNEEQGNIHDDVEISYQDIQMQSKDGRAEIVFAVYKNFDELLKISSNASLQPPSLYSHVVGLSINEHGQHINLTKPVKLTLEHVQTTNQSTACVFWKVGNSTSPGAWSSDGCTKIQSNMTHTHCECNHLTSFAILINHKGHGSLNIHVLVLSFITWVGLTASLICLALSIATFIYFKSLHCHRTTIHTNLCICLFISQLIFLTSIDLHHLPVVCSVIAGILHYTFLATFTWMALEGFQLYVMLVEVFERFTSVMWYYVIGYGVPALFVAIPAAINYKGYGTDTACWLSTDMGGANSLVPFIWAFIGPATFVGLANIFFIVVTTIAIYTHARKYVYYSKLKAARSSLSATCALLFLLGSTWTFGIIWWWKQLVILEYLFCILNAFQGVYIFLFHCILHNKVRYEYRNLLAQCFGENYFENSTTSSLTVKYSGGRRRSSHTYHPKKWKSSSTIKNNPKLSSHDKHGNNSVKAILRRRQSAPHITCRSNQDHDPGTMQAIITRKNSVTYVQPRNNSIFSKTESNCESNKPFFAQRHFSSSLHQLSISEVQQTSCNELNEQVKRHSMVSAVKPCTSLVKDKVVFNDSSNSVDHETELLLGDKSKSLSNLQATDSASNLRRKSIH